MRDVRIVPYEGKYRKAVRECVYETGYGGKSVAPFFEDRELFADWLTLYYTDYEPESAYVPLVDGEPGGYLLGCVDTVRCERVMRGEILPGIAKKLLLGGYRDVGPAARRYMRRILLKELRGESVAAPVKEYPAHLHIDLFEGCRRLGVGSQLVGTWLDVLRGKGVRGVHLGTSSFHREGIPFYEKLGFRRWGMVRVTASFFREVSDRDLIDYVFVKDL